MAQELNVRVVRGNGLSTHQGIIAVFAMYGKYALQRRSAEALRRRAPHHRLIRRTLRLFLDAKSITAPRNKVENIIMNKLSVATVCLTACLFTSFAAAQTTPLSPNLVTADWSAKQVNILNAEPKDAVWKFINNLWGSSDDLNGGSGEVCHFQFVNLRHSRQLSLVVSYDNGGLADCNMVNIFDKAPAGIENFDFNSSTQVYLDSIQDINKDGHYEVVVDSDFVTGIRDECTATWPVIYAWSGTGYADVSGKFKGFYRQRLAELQRQITPPSAPILAQTETYASHPTDAGGPQVEAQFGRSEQAAPTPVPAAGNTDCLKAEAAKIERFIGPSSDAGMSDAIRWAESDDPRDREFAASILFDIGTPEAIEDLRTLSNDTNQSVAAAGKEFLKGAPNGQTAYPTIQGKLIPVNTGY